MNKLIELHKKYGHGSNFHNRIKYSNDNYRLYIAACKTMTLLCIAKNMSNAINKANTGLKHYLTDKELNTLVYTEHETVKEIRDYLRN